MCYALNSLENRVYEVELDDGQRVIAKFYRPGRWSPQTILDEHRLLEKLAENEIPVCQPLAFHDGTTLHQTLGNIYFALFPKVGGRGPDDLTTEEFEQLGRLIARIHNVAAPLPLEHRPSLSPKTYGTEALATILELGKISPALAPRYQQAAELLIAKAQALWGEGQHFVIHADCHRGNLLRGTRGWFFLDFDDCARGPAVQDLWLLLPARQHDCPEELTAMLRGYEMFRSFDHTSLRLIEALRGLRYLRYAAWIARRWDDPSFPRAFPNYGTENYWNEQLTDLYEQLQLLND